MKTQELKVEVYADKSFDEMEKSDEFDALCRFIARMILEKKKKQMKTEVQR